MQHPRHQESSLLAIMVGADNQKFGDPYPLIPWLSGAKQRVNKINDLIPGDPLPHEQIIFGRYPQPH